MTSARQAFSRKTEIAEWRNGKYLTRSIDRNERHV